MNDERMQTENNEPTQPIHLEKTPGRVNRTVLDRKGDELPARLPKNSPKTEKLETLAKARLHYPENKQLKTAIYEEVKEVVNQDPFLAYEDETETLYKVQDHAKEVLIVPKERAVPEPFPVQRPEPLRKAYRFLLWAALGLILSGLGAVIFAVPTVMFAARAMESDGRYDDRARARVILALAAILFLAGLTLAYLFWIHWVG